MNMNMKTKDILKITTVAFSTAAMTVATFWPGPMEAGSDTEGPAAKIAQPKLVIHGVESSVALAGRRAVKAGEQPEFELTAVNTTGQAASARLAVLLTSSMPPERMSRVLSLPMVLWQQELVLSLKAKETKVISFTAKTNLPVNSLVSVRLGEAQPGAAVAGSPAIQTRSVGMASLPQIVALSFSTVVAPAPTVAALTPAH